MKKFYAFLMVATLICFAPYMAQAQDGGDLDKRIELAVKMHEIRPLGDQIEEIVTKMASRYPGEKQEAFRKRMLEVFDKKTLTDMSVKAMAETFTVAELEKMIDFHGSPEGKSVNEKMAVYQSLVQPEIVKKIDEALLTVRTGSGSDAR